MNRVLLTSIMASMFLFGLAAGIGVRGGLNERSPGKAGSGEATQTQRRDSRGGTRPEATVTPVRSLRPVLYVPRLGLHTFVRSPENLNLGPAWWPTTGRPGGGDTVAIAGHRITHTHPFYYLDRVRLGDHVYLSAGGRDFTYTVARVYTRPSTDMHIADATGSERLLLTACTPRGSAKFRLVIEARLTGVK